MVTRTVNLNSPEITLELALRYMLKLIAEGYEYPDAQWKASQRYHVSADDLTEAYDAQ